MLLCFGKTCVLQMLPRRRLTGELSVDCRRVGIVTPYTLELMSCGALVVQSLA